MRKIRIFVILAPLVVCALFVTVYFRSNPIREPKLKIEFNPSPPWRTRPGENLELNITITNEGKSRATNVNLTLTASIGFTISKSGTNTYTRNITQLEAGEKQNETLSMTVSTTTKPGNYTITVTISADNVPKKSYNHQIKVELPYIP